MRTRPSICLGKTRFGSVRDAVVAACDVGLPLRPYRCDRCHQVHLTSRTKGKFVGRGQSTAQELLNAEFTV
jgi:hypothetical protein